MKVYWIRRCNMTDIFNEGYVGVTSLSLSERMNQHSKNVYRKSVVKKAIDKYSDIIIDLVYEGNDRECLDLEASYRPSENIGWNIAKGGNIPTAMNSEKAAKISKTLKEKNITPYTINTHSPAAIAKRKASMAGRKWFHNPTTFENRRLLEQPSGWLPGIIRAT
jgi:hypothetical protein